MSYLIILFYFSSHPTQKERRRPSSCENIFPYDAYIENSYSTFRKCNRPSRTCMVIATNFQEHFNLKKKKENRRAGVFKVYCTFLTPSGGRPATGDFHVTSEFLSLEFHGATKINGGVGYNEPAVDRMTK